MRTTSSRGWGKAASVALLLSAMAGMEWWTTTQMGLLLVPAGVLSGVCLAGLLLMLTLYPARAGHWAAAVMATLRAVAELVLGGVVVSALAVLAVLMLPVSVSASVFQGDAATDVVLFTLVGLALWVAARSVLRYAAQRQSLMAVSLQAEKARSEAAEREKELAQSQLMLLRAQVEPHFLWNTLAHVQHLIRKNPDDAGRMTGHLIQYLRTAVPQMRGDASTLGVEMASVSAYLALMQIRMGDRLSYGLHLPAELAELPVPTLLLQPLVENSIRHGLEPQLAGGHIAVQAGMLDDSRLLLSVHDNGLGLPVLPGQPPSGSGSGFGLQQIRERLASRYGGAARFDLTADSAGGTRACIVLPLKSQP